MNGRKRVLLVCHEASRTGAPKVLSDVLRSLPPERFETHLVFRLGGSLRAELAGLADCVLDEPLQTRRAERLSGRLGQVASRLEERVAGWVIRRVEPDLVYANSVVAASYAIPALWSAIPLILHLHEEGKFLQEFVHRFRLSNRLAPYNEKARVVACAGAIGKQLGSDFAAGTPITVIPEPVDPPAVRAASREGLEAPEWSQHDLVVGAVGNVQERKGPDLWLESASRVLERRPDADVAFVWIGTGDQLPRMRADANRSPLRGRVYFVGEQKVPFPAMARFDVMTLPSRNDPFPLTVLEAMALAKPVIAFDIGGVAEQLNGAGILIPPGDAGAFADAVLRLLDHPEERSRLGHMGSTRVDRHFHVRRFRERVLHLVDEMLGNSA